MSWSVIIAAFMAFLKPILDQLGPKIAELIMNWINGLFTKQAAKLGKVSDFNTSEEASRALLKASYDATPRIRVVKRHILLWLMPRAEVALAGGKASKADREDFATVAKGVKSEM